MNEIIHFRCSRTTSTTSFPLIRTQQKVKVLKNGKVFNAIAASISKNNALDVMLNGNKELCIWNSLKGWVIQN